MPAILSLDELKGIIGPSLPRPSLLLHDIGDRKGLLDRANRGRWKEILKAKLSRCDDTLNEPIQQFPRSLYDDFFRTGRRDRFEGPLSHRRGITEDLAQAYVLTGKREYLDRCRDYIWATIEEFTWIAPAHAYLPLRSDAVTQVDIYSSEVALLMADLWDLLHDDLDAETLGWMRRKVIHEVLIPLRDHLDEQWWARSFESNWTGVCCGNSGCALILTALDEPWAIELLHKLLTKIDGFLSTADPDGAWVEGVGYWFYGFLSVIYLSDLLTKITGGQYDLLENPTIRSTATFPVWMHLPPRFQVNFGDVGDTPSVFPEALTKLQEHYQDPSIAWYARRLEGEGLLGGGSTRDLLWGSAISNLKSSPPADTSRWYRKVGIIVTRASWQDPDAPVLAVKAGHNNEPHNHLDVGQFIYHCYGHSFICDLGDGIYDRDYFGPKRYENPICGSEGHNLIFVDGKGQAPGREHGGKIVEYVREPRYERIRMDLTKAYPSEVLSGAFRSLIFLKGDGLILMDEVRCQSGAVVESRLHFKGEPDDTPSGVRISSARGNVFITCEAPSTKIEIGTHKGLRLEAQVGADVRYARLLTRGREESATIMAYVVPHRTEDELLDRLEALRSHADALLST